MESKLVASSAPCFEFQGNSYGVLDATITGAVQAPFFFKGQSTEEEWRTTLRTSPVPFAELGSDKCVCVY
jgi:hypothetical protein